MVSPNRVRVQHGNVVYESITAAVEATGVSRNLINAYCKKPEVTGWEKLDHQPGPKVSHAGNIWCIKGKIYHTSKEAANANGVTKASIRFWVNDPDKPDCYRVLSDGTRYKDTQAHHKRIKRRNADSRRFYHKNNPPRASL